MIHLPIAVREMRVMARAPRFFWARVIAAALLGLLSLAFVQLGGMTSIPAKLRFMEFVGSTLAVVALLGGCSSTSDALSSERREGTLPLVFLTPLRYLEILIGKLVAANLSIATPLLGGFPVATLVLMQSGLSFAQMAHMLAGAFLILMVAGCFGLAASSACLKRRNAASLSTTFALVLWIGVPVAVEALRVGDPGSVWLRWLAHFKISTLTSPTVVSTAAGLELWWKSFACFVGLGCCGLGLAWIGLRRARVERLRQTSWLTWRGRWRQWCYGQGPKRAKHRRRALDLNPFYWLSSRDRLRRVLPFLVALLIWGVPLVFWWRLPDLGRLFATHVAWVVVGVLVAKYALSSESVRAFIEEREQGSFEFVVSTPLDVGDILRGHFRGVLTHSAPLVVPAFAGLLWLVAITLLGRSHLRLTGGEVVWTLVATAILGGWFVTGLFSQPLVGVWAAMTAKRLRSANSQSVFIGLLFPFVAFAIGVPLLGLAAIFGLLPSLSEDTILFLFLVAVVLLTTGADIFWFLFLRRLIPLKFRTWASERHQAEPREKRPSLLARLLGGRRGHP